MALTLGDNFSYQGAKPLDARLKYDTLAAMKAVADATMYEGCMAYCSATDKTYQWKSTNTVDADTGKWREFSSGGGGGTSDYPDLTNKPSIEGVTLTGNKTASDLGLAKASQIPTVPSAYTSTPAMDGTGSAGSSTSWAKGDHVHPSDTSKYGTDDTAETALADADKFPFYDNSASAKRSSTWSNIKSVLKTYFDTLYSTTKTRGTATAGGTTLSLVNTGDMYNWNTDSVIYCTCATTAATTAKVATVSRGTFTLVAGAKVCVKFTYGNTAESPTLNVSSKGAKNIKYIGTDGTVGTPNVWWGAGDVVTFIYDGTQFLMQPTYGMPSIPVLGTIDRSDIYSTTEKVVGCYTDGRPLYQKVVEFGTLPNNTSKTVAHGISNINKIVDIRITVEASSGTTSVVPFISTSLDGNDIYGTVDKTYCKIGTNSDRTMFSAFFVLKYTKTTDAANSFNYASENDYSTTEKIIGTWIDGSKIYQKTFTGTLTNTTTEGTETITTFSIGASVKYVVRVEGFVYITASGIWQPLCTLKSGNNALMTLRMNVNDNSASTNKNSILINNGWYKSGTNTYYVTLQYTKTS